MTLRHRLALRLLDRGRSQISLALDGDAEARRALCALGVGPQELSDIMLARAERALERLRGEV